MCEWFDFFRGHSLYSTTTVYLVVAIYDVRSSHIVSIRYEQTEIEINLRLICRYPHHFSKQHQQPIRTCKMGRDVV